MPYADDLLTDSTPSSVRSPWPCAARSASIAGAGTGKTRAITHRIAYGVATGVYKPTEVLAVTFTTRAAGEMRVRLRQLGAEGVQARTFHSAALRQVALLLAQALRRRVPRADRVEVPAGRRGGEAVPASRPTPRSCATSPPRSSGPRSPTSVPTTTPRLAPDAHRGRRCHRRRDRRPRDGRLRGGQARPWPHRHGGHPARHRLRSSPTTSGSRPRSAASTGGSSSTSSRTSTRSSPHCSTCGSGVATTSASSVTRARPSTRSRGPRRKHPHDFAKTHPGARRIELVRNYRSTPQIVAAANAVFGRGRREGVVLQSQHDAGSRGHLHAVLRRAGRGRVRRREILLLREGGTPLREMAILFRINAQSEAYEEALAARNLRT